jgi:uncharacterized membrane protein YqhA
VRREFVQKLEELRRAPAYVTLESNDLEELKVRLAKIGVLGDVKSISICTSERNLHKCS